MYGRKTSCSLPMASDALRKTRCSWRNVSTREAVESYIRIRSSRKLKKSYHAVWLENEYIKVMILPELGGRIQMAFDKVKQRHFIYYNHVIKPALVGLTGPWISGGIEFNWPQHHRPSTFLPVDYSIERCKDGSVVVWVSERERMFGQKGTAGFTLRPGRAVLQPDSASTNFPLVGQSGRSGQ